MAKKALQAAHQEVCSEKSRSTPWKRMQLGVRFSGNGQPEQLIHMNTSPSNSRLQPSCSLLFSLLCTDLNKQPLGFLCSFRMLYFPGVIPASHPLLKKRIVSRIARDHGYRETFEAFAMLKVEVELVLDC